VGTVVAGYGWFLVREPRMLQQMFAFVPPVREYQVYALMLWRICREPVLLLAVGGLLLRPRALRHKERLVWLFAACSAAAALLTNLQAGGNVNYYFEGLFAMVPFAAYCVIRLPRYTRAQTLPGILLPLLLVAGFVMPMAESIARQEVPALLAAPARDRSIVALDRVLKSRNIFSTAPRLALFSAHPPLTEPFLFTMLNRTGKVSLADFTEPLGRQEFDAVVTSAIRRSYRGVEYIGPELRAAIQAFYYPDCIYGDYLIHLPRARRANDGLAGDLRKVGCTPVGNPESAALATGRAW
jgi:hypothetical protein